MHKLILTFSLAVLLSACATLHKTPVITDVNYYRQPDFFAGYTQGSFEVKGTFEDLALEGVLIVKKLGPNDYEANLLSGGLFQVMKATVTPEGIAWQYLFKDVDNALVRGRITQLLDLLLMPKRCKKADAKNGEAVLTCDGVRAKERFYYAGNEPDPVRAQTVTLLNTADLEYTQYTDAFAESGRLPGRMIYRDGKITLYLTLFKMARPLKENSAE